MKQNNPKIIYRLKKQIILCKEIKENKDTKCKRFKELLISTVKS